MAEKALTAVIQEAHIQGVSTRSVKNLVQAMAGNRNMKSRITIGRHDSGAIEIAVWGAFASVMQAASLVERHALKTKKHPDALAAGGCLSMVAEAGNH